MNMDTTLASVMKNIADALQLDSNNKLEVIYMFNKFIDLTLQYCSMKSYTLLALLSTADQI